MSSADVTVAVATCGRAAALSRCLEALSAGSVVPGEVIVVDQDPSAETRAVAAGAALPVRHLEQRRRGLSASRNLALSAAGRTMLAVTDDDCVPDGRWVEALLAALEREPLPAAVTGSILPLGTGAPGTYAISLRDATEPRDFSGRPLPWDAGSGANFAARCDVLRGLGGWDERLGAGAAGRAAEDADLLDRLFRAGHLVRFDPAAVVRHEWQTRERRLATRWSYAFGVGGLGGLRLRAGDSFGPRMLLGYLRLHARPLVRAAVRGDGGSAREHLYAAAGLVAGLAWGLATRLPAGGGGPATDS